MLHTIFPLWITGKDKVSVEMRKSLVCGSLDFPVLCNQQVPYLDAIETSPQCMTVTEGNVSHVSLMGS